MRGDVEKFISIQYVTAPYFFRYTVEIQKNQNFIPRRTNENEIFIEIQWRRISKFKILKKLHFFSLRRLCSRKPHRCTSKFVLNSIPHCCIARAPTILFHRPLPTVSITATFIFKCMHLFPYSATSCVGERLRFQASSAARHETVHGRRALRSPWRNHRSALFMCLYLPRTVRVPMNDARMACASADLNQWLRRARDVQ